jgi:hypothetical protein
MYLWRWLHSPNEEIVTARAMLVMPHRNLFFFVEQFAIEHILLRDVNVLSECALAILLWVLVPKAPNENISFWMWQCSMFCWLIGPCHRDCGMSFTNAMGHKSPAWTPLKSPGSTSTASYTSNPSQNISTMPLATAGKARDCGTQAPRLRGNVTTHNDRVA